jgi:hypothetical protein
MFRRAAASIAQDGASQLLRSISNDSVRLWEVPECHLCAAPHGSCSRAAFGRHPVLSLDGTL